MIVTPPKKYAYASKLPMPVYKSAYRPETAMVKLCYDMVLTDKHSQLMKKAMDKDLDTKLIKVN